MINRGYMGFIINIQGGMAAGKSSLVRMIDKNYSDITVSYENISPIIEQIKSSNLDKNILEDYLEIQKLFIKYEIERFLSLKNKEKVIIDLGTDEIDFYTVNYPKSIGKEWNIEQLLEKELKELRLYKSDLTIFLSCSKQQLQQRKNFDKNRGRSFFDHYINNLHDLKLNWFENKDNVEYIDTNGLAQNDVYSEIKEILNKFT